MKPTIVFRPNRIGTRRTGDAVAEAEKHFAKAIALSKPEPSEAEKVLAHKRAVKAAQMRRYRAKKLVP